MALEGKATATLSAGENTEAKLCGQGFQSESGVPMGSQRGHSAPERTSPVTSATALFYGQALNRLWVGGSWRGSEG